MTTRQIEVHNHYKAMHPKALVLYRLPSQYIVLGEDVKQALKSVPTIQIIEDGVGVMPEDISYISSLGIDGTEVVMIQFRNDNGLLDIPDIARLIQEKEIDY